MSSVKILHARTVLKLRRYVQLPVVFEHLWPATLQALHHKVFHVVLLNAVTHILQPQHTHCELWIHNTCIQGPVTVCLHAMNPQVLSCTKTLAYDVVICARTWKKCSCFSLLQKNGCLSTALAVGRRDGSLEIILLIKSRAQMLLESAKHAKP